MPGQLRAGWTLIERGLATRDKERDAIPTAAWIAAHGAGLGFRSPNVGERARAMGMAACLGNLQQLGMSDYQLFNAQGNSFDRAAVAFRLREAITTWVLGGELPRHAYPAPAEVLEAYNLLKGAALSAGMAACPSPCPRELHDTLIHGARGLSPAETSPPSGRRRPQ